MKRALICLALAALLGACRHGVGLAEPASVPPPAAEAAGWSASVAQVSGDFFYIDAGLPDALQVGDSLVVYRKGAPILDPGDRETVIGYEEVVAGEGRVVAVEPKMSKVRLIRKASELQVGDRVKLLAGRDEDI